MQSIGTPFMWGIFTVVVLVMLAIDLFLVGGGKRHRVSIKEAATWSVIWPALAWLIGIIAVTLPSAVLVYRGRN